MLWNEYSIIPREQLLIDISSPTAISLDARKLWLLIVDDCTDYAWSYILNKKVAAKQS